MRDPYNDFAGSLDSTPLTITSGSRHDSSGAQPSCLTSSCPITNSGSYARMAQTETPEPCAMIIEMAVRARLSALPLILDPEAC